MAKSAKQELSAAVDTLRDAPLQKLPEVTPLVLKDAAGPAEAGDGRIEYTVTDRAPSRVAGRRVKPGDTLRLTEDEARGELLALHIAPPSVAGSDEQTDADAETV